MSVEGDIGESTSGSRSASRSILTSRSGGCILTADSRGHGDDDGATVTGDDRA